MFFRVISTVLFAGLLPLAASGAPKKKRTRVVPEITYRQAYLEDRPDAAMRRTTQKNYVDQIYLSLKLVKTFDYVNELVVEPAVRTPRTDPGADPEVVIDQGYVAATISKFDLTAGKKSEYEGTGYFVNPSDLLNEDKDLFDPLYQRRGQTFTRIRWRFMDNWSVAGGYIPSQRKAAHHGRTWTQLAGDVADTDLRFQHTYNFRYLSTFGFSASRFFGDTVELHVDSRYQQRQRDSDEEPERIVYDCAAIGSTKQINDQLVNTSSPDYSEEYALNCIDDPAVERDTGTFYTVAGTRIVLTPKRTVILEAIQNQAGLNSDEIEMYYTYLRVERDGSNIEPDPQTRLIGRQYWFAAYQDEDSIPRTMLNLSYLFNQDDQSSFVSGEARYTLSPIANISIANTQFIGSGGSEFGEAPAKQVTYLIIRGKF